MQYKYESYALVLKDDWVEEPGTDPEQHVFRSTERDVNLVTSSLGMDASGANLERIAHKFAELRIDGEKRGAAAFGATLAMAEPIVVERSWGFVVAYYGSDSSGRRFNFSGIVTKWQFLSLYVDSRTLGEEELGSVLSEVVFGVELLEPYEPGFSPEPQA
jgi:hypothetical protein